MVGSLRSDGGSGWKLFDLRIGNVVSSLEKVDWERFPVSVVFVLLILRIGAIDFACVMVLVIVFVLE